MSSIFLYVINKGGNGKDVENFLLIQRVTDGPGTTKDDFASGNTEVCIYKKDDPLPRRTYVITKGSMVTSEVGCRTNRTVTE